MKKMILAAALLAGATASMSAQELTLQKPGFGDNWWIGLDGGVTTPLYHGSSFFGDMRGLVGLNIKKQITPAVGLGVEGQFGINTSSWKGAQHSSLAFDNSYVGVYTAVNLWNLFLPYGAQQNRVFDMEAVAGAGWGHGYMQKSEGHDWNDFDTKVGLNFNFYPCKNVAISIKPSVIWDMSGARTYNSTASYNSQYAAFNLQAGVSVLLGNGFTYLEPNYNLDELAALNAQVNALRGDLDAASVALAATTADNAALAAQLEACQNQKPVVVKENTDILSTVRYVNFALGRYNVPADQQPNVAAVASYLKNHPEAKVVVKGYASQDGPEDVNIRLANQRAESVKNMLINKYGIKADRINAEGQGIGHMFEEESWNRVAVCILDNAPVTTTTISK